MSTSLSKDVNGVTHVTASLFSFVTSPRSETGDNPGDGSYHLLRRLTTLTWPSKVDNTFKLSDEWLEDVTWRLPALWQPRHYCSWYEFSYWT